MELDLDAFLGLQSTTDDDDDEDLLNSFPRRTVDQILDDSDSSSSSSSSSLSLLRRSDRTVSPTKPEINRDDDASVSSSKTLTDTRIDETLISSSEYQSKLSSVGRIRSGGNSFLLGRNGLFGGVRSNAKPGAALAAAAAASRSVPTPHAAAIKSQRASAAAVVVLDSSEELGGPSHGDFGGFGDSSDVSISVSLENGRSLIEEDDRMSDFQSAAVAELESTPKKVDVGEEISGVGVRDRLSEDGVNYSNEVSSNSHEPHISSHLHNGENTILDDNFPISDPNVPSPSPEENNDVNSVFVNSTEKEIPSSPGLDKGREVVEDLTIAIHETEDLDKVMTHSKDTEENLAGEETSLRDDVTDIIEERMLQWESEKGTRKKSRSSLKPLELAEEMEKKHAFTGLHWEEGVAAQPMRLEGVRRGSTALGYFDIDTNNTITRTISSQGFRRDHGSAHVVAVHLNFIAVGMSKGLILVVPSNYSPHCADNMDAKMLMLGLQGDRSEAAVTSMCFNQQGDLLFAGYGDGRIIVWDVQKGSAVKVITESHKAPVVHMLYLGQDSQVTRQFKVVSGDSKGLVWLIIFSVVPWLNRFSFKTACLLDGKTTGKVLCASPLLSDECCGGALMSSQVNTTVPSGAIGTMMGGVVGGDSGWKFFAEGSSLVEEGVVIFVTHQTALVARLSPKVEGYAQFSKPDGVREGSMPYTAWKCMAQTQSSSTGDMPVEASEKVSLLAIAWDRKVQVAKLVKSELKVCGKWTLESPAIGLAWLDDQMLVVLTMSGQLSLFAKDGTVIHQTSFSVDGSGGDDLVAYHTHFTNIFGNPEKAYHNSIAVRGASIYILGPMHLVVSRLLPWKERIQVLRKAGDWMGALSMAMALYDGQAHGVIDLPGALDALQETIMPHLEELLLSYVDEVFSYISVAVCNQIGKLEQSDDSKSRSRSVHSEIKEQFTRVGGVAVEFCVHIKRTDILYDEILSKFVAVQHRDTFLELLEPYILKDMLGSLPPEVMQALVEHYSAKGWLQRVEQCVLHMDISSLDFNQVVRLCREHRLYGALIYLFNRGLDDFKAPLEELLAVLRNSQKGSAAALGYRMLVYLKYCFSGLDFPPGRGTLAPTRLPSLRIELLQFLLEDSNAPNSWAVTSLSCKGAYLNLYHLLELDTEATLDVLTCAFVEDEIPSPDYSSHDSTNANVEANKELDKMIENQNLLVQKTVNALVLILETVNSQTGSDDNVGVEHWPSKKDIGRMLEFTAYYVSCNRSNVSRSILNQIFEYFTSEINLPPSVSRQNDETLKRREKQVFALLEVVPETNWDAVYLLHLCEKAQFYQVCGLIHAIRHQFVAALDSYMKDMDEPIHAFSFIIDTMQQLNDTESDAFQSAVISRMADLINLSREDAFFLIIDSLNKESQDVLSELRSHPRSLFLYLKTVVEVHLSGTLNFSCLRERDNVEYPSGIKARHQAYRVEAYMERIANFPKFIRNNPVHLSDEVIELYLELLCQYEHNSVLKFLETFESYRVEHCLRLCQEYGIIDGAAFLLERVGDVGNALSLTLSGLTDKFAMLDTAVENVASDTGLEHFSSVLKEEVNGVNDILRACIGMCQRNTPRLDLEESESLWFRLLDSFCKPLMDSCNDITVTGGENQVGMVDQLLDKEEHEEACIVKWKISKSHKGAHILRRLFSQFIKEIVEGMIGYVRLPTIMSKLLSDNGSQEFGDFKVTILGMLGTYGFERRILDTAKSLIEDDTFYTMSLLKKGASHGYAPRSLLCCICNCILTKNSTSGIRVFNCGHAIHIHCEFPENERGSHRGSHSLGCPVCLPTKKGQRTGSKTVHAENGLMSKSLPRHRQTQGSTALHPYETDAFENSYGLQQISRFEMLANLQKDQRVIQIENMPQLRLAPPAVYHEKVKKGIEFITGESSSSIAKIEKASKNRQKAKGTSIRFPLKSTIFGKEKNTKR